MSSKSTTPDDEEEPTLERLREEFGDELDRIAESDLDANWVAEALREEDGDE